MRHLTILILLSLTFMASCNKDKDIVDPPAPVPVIPLDDKRDVLLKDVVEQGLPSPYFHFEYEAGYVKEIGFASNFFQYDVKYANKRVSKMTNRPNGAELTYHYYN